MNTGIVPNDRQDLIRLEEDPRFLTEQLLTYIGNKRALLGFIGLALDRVRQRLGKDRLSTADLFSGSGIVARYLKRYSEKLVVNDLERYSGVINRCYLANASELDLDRIREMHVRILSGLSEQSLKPGIISRYYAPEDDETIKPGERVFYTSRNARYLDTACSLIDHLDPGIRDFLLAPLLSEASIHANTAGVFKGFYKDSGTGLGCFGGRDRNALSRITGQIHLPFPVFSRFDTDVTVYREDANSVVSRIRDLDLAYIDPPYNQHPYGSNYFMLNLLVQYEEPEVVSPVSGIPDNWQRSRYNSRKKAFKAFSDLVESLDSKFLLISFNSEGFIPRNEMMSLLSRIGRLEVRETPYNTFRGSRNLGRREIHVTEYLFLVER